MGQPIEIVSSSFKNVLTHSDDSLKNKTEPAKRYHSGTAAELKLIFRLGRYVQELIDLLVPNKRHTMNALGKFNDVIIGDHFKRKYESERKEWLCKDLLHSQRD
ncbi:hypothetical protein M514_05918 [Trichuris suis]|uniref:Uncharacterized protein n=1 Tax=Trichuris suis TaxID=68888 RepID=A0A085M7L2_9BILA|nr:hypothetical protein M513_05918 [Trichuris suis]KFD65583.1 hypothetical protein M514_05918 [Trichuris suis]